LQITPIPNLSQNRRAKQFQACHCVIQGGNLNQVLAIYPDWRVLRDKLAPSMPAAQKENINLQSFRAGVLLEGIFAVR